MDQVGVEPTVLVYPIKSRRSSATRRIDPKWCGWRDVRPPLELGKLPCRYLHIIRKVATGVGAAPTTSVGKTEDIAGYRTGRKLAPPGFPSPRGARTARMTPLRTGLGAFVAGTP